MEQASKNYILNMAVNKKENGKYVPVGKVSVPVFCLKDFGLPIEATGISEEGLPTYTNPRHQAVQDAMTAAIKSSARNKLITETVNLKVGSKIAETVEEFLAGGSTSGAALALHREFLTAFFAWLPSSGKTANAQALYTNMVKNKASIVTSTEARKAGLLAVLESFLTSLSEDDKVKFANTLESYANLCEEQMDLDDSEL